MRTKTSFLTLLFVSCGLMAAGAVAQESGKPFYRVEETTVRAGDFTIVGDLYIPVEGSRHPAAVWVHGSGPLTRQLMKPLLWPQIEVFLKAGFAFFLDDIPGAGASKGEVQNVFEDRALILANEVEALGRRADIIPSRVGVVGSSQAGIVMPLATTKTAGIAFMIAEACVAESAYRQDAYLLKQLMICEGLPADEAEKAARFQVRRYETDDYQEYLAAVAYLDRNESARMIGVNNPAMNEEKFKARDKSPSKLGSRYDPMPVVAGLQFPILALFAEKDKNIDPVQGYEAYRQAFKIAANGLNRVEMIPESNHMLYEAKTGCARELLAQVGAGKPLYSPRALSIIGEWLGKLRASLGPKE